MGEVIRGILIPFLGTTLGASCVLFMKKMMNMVSASVWSLLIPSMDYAAEMGKFAFVPAVVGFWIGILFLLAMDHIIPHLHMDTDKAEGPKSKLKKTTMLVFAVTLHNIPEGMAVGVVYAGYLAGIISMPLKAEGMSKGKAFLYGVLSGVVEPIGAVLTVVASGFIIPVLPYFLSFAAGAMMYVVIEELIPEMSHGNHSNISTVMFAVGFTLMMILDVALG